MKKVDIAQQRGKKEVIVEHHGKSRHSAAARIKVDKVEDHEKGSHSAAAWKK